MSSFIMLSGMILHEGEVQATIMWLSHVATHIGGCISCQDYGSHLQRTKRSHNIYPCVSLLNLSPPGHTLITGESAAVWRMNYSRSLVALSKKAATKCLPDLSCQTACNAVMVSALFQSSTDVIAHFCCLEQWASNTPRLNSTLDSNETSWAVSPQEAPLLSDTHLRRNLIAHMRVYACDRSQPLDKQAGRPASSRENPCAHCTDSWMQLLKEGLAQVPPARGQEMGIRYPAAMGATDSRDMHGCI